MNSSHSSDNLSNDHNDSSDHITLLNNAENSELNESISNKIKWNNLTSTKLLKLGEKAEELRTLHSIEYQHYKKIASWIDFFKISLYVFIMVLSGGGLYALFSIETQESKYVNVVSIILLLFQGILEGIIKKNNYEKTIINHNRSSKKYNEIYLEIQTIFSIPVNKREKLHKFLMYINKEFINTMNQAPFIRKSLTDQKNNEKTDKKTIINISDDVLNSNIEKWISV